MMKLFLTGAIIVLSAASAVAQTTPANPDAHTPAVATSSTVNPGAPAAGKNSFTEAQAKSRIEKAGYLVPTRAVRANAMDQHDRRSVATVIPVTQLGTVRPLQHPLSHAPLSVIRPSQA
jgi:hypothetical protein